MATTYDYETRKITRDWHFVENGDICKGSGLPCYAGSNRCRGCGYYRGAYWNSIKCSHPDKQDWENAPLSSFYEDFENDALTHMYD